MASERRAIPDGAPLNRVGKPHRETAATKWNREALRRLSNMLKKDPEADLASLLTSSYSTKLKALKAPQPPSTKKTSITKHSFASSDIRSRLSASDPTTVIFQPSAELGALLGNDDNCSTAIIDLLANSEVVYRSAWAASVMVFRFGNIAIKVTSGGNIRNEHQTLRYLREHLPSFPVPRPHGLIRSGIFYCLFTTFIPGLDLEKAWCQLDNSQKRSISAQLRTLFVQLRSLPFADGTPLGSVDGEGCRDARRTVRVSSTPIMDGKQFQDWIFSGSTTASAPYTRLLRRLFPTAPATPVFTHGDVRPANIIVANGEGGPWHVVGIIDWEASGFYPEYWESVKATNNLTPRDQSDWYEHLPDPLSSHQYPIPWLVDRIWDQNMDS